MSQDISQDIKNLVAMWSTKWIMTPSIVPKFWLKDKKAKITEVDITKT